MFNTFIFILDDIARRKIAGSTFYKSHFKPGISTRFFLFIAKLDIFRITGRNNFFLSIGIYAFIVITREFSAPIADFITIFKIVNHNRFAHSDFENRYSIKCSLIRSILCSFSKFRFPALKDIVIFLVRSLFWSISIVLRHRAFRHRLLIYQFRTVIERNFKELRITALHVVNLQ